MIFCRQNSTSKIYFGRVPTSRPKKTTRGRWEQQPASRGSSKTIFTTVPDTSIPEVNLSKKEKGKKAAKEKTVVIDPEDPYPKFMDREWRKSFPILSSWIGS